MLYYKKESINYKLRNDDDDNSNINKILVNKGA